MVAMTIIQIVSLAGCIIGIFISNMMFDYIMYYVFDYLYPLEELNETIIQEFKEYVYHKYNITIHNNTVIKIINYKKLKHIYCNLCYAYQYDLCWHRFKKYIFDNICKQHYCNYMCLMTIVYLLYVIIGTVLGCMLICPLIVFYVCNNMCNCLYLICDCILHVMHKPSIYTEQNLMSDIENRTIAENTPIIIEPIDISQITIVENTPPIIVEPIDISEITIL